MGRKRHLLVGKEKSCCPLMLKIRVNIAATRIRCISATMLGEDQHWHLASSIVKWTEESFAVMERPVLNKNLPRASTVKLAPMSSILRNKSASVTITNVKVSRMPSNRHCPKYQNPPSFLKKVT